MFDDFKEPLSAFNAHHVKYLIVGGYAVSFYAQPRATKDLDLFIQADPANAHATYAALAGFGAPMSNIHEEDLADPRKFIRFGQAPVAIDILPGIDGVKFDDAWERRIGGVIDPESGLAAFFISKADLIASKLASGRMRDPADVEEIREAEVSQQEPATEKPAEPKE
jgi:hypothetical protein